MNLLLNKGRRNYEKIKLIKQLWCMVAQELKVMGGGMLVNDFD